MDDLKEFAPVTPDGEVRKKVLCEGTGPKPLCDKGAKAVIHFVAYRDDGVKVDSSREMRLGPFELRMGKEFCVKAWEPAVRSMRIGEKALFHCSTTYASGYPQLSQVLRKQDKKKRAEEEEDDDDAEEEGAHQGHGHSHAHGHGHSHDSNGHSHSHGDGHGHSHANGGGHGHSHAHEDHGHSHANGEGHGHSHANGNGCTTSSDCAAEKCGDGACSTGAACAPKPAKKKKAKRVEEEEDDGGHACCGAGMQKMIKENGDLLALYGRDMRFEIELLRVDEAGTYQKDHWEMSLDEKREVAPRLKEEGNELYKRGEYARAAEKYGIAIAYCEQVLVERRPGDSHPLDAVLSACQLNYAACKGRLEEWEEVIKHTTAILEKDPKNIKALFRRGQAHARRGRDLELAEKDLSLVESLDPDNADAKKELRLVKTKMSAAEKKEKAMFGGMFAR
eukprot:Opistho-1_new@6319